MPDPSLPVQLSFLEQSQVADSKLMHYILCMPKIDLHRHLTGSIDAEIAINVATEYHISLPSYVRSDLHEILYGAQSVNSLRDYFAPWNILNPLFSYRHSIYDLMLQVTRKAATDNVAYMEMRVSPRGFLGRDNYSFEEYLTTLTEAAIDATEQTGTIVKLILGIPRHVYGRIPETTRNKMFGRMIDMLLDYNSVFVGVDLNGDESVSPLSDFKTFFKIARSKGFNVTVHAGECGPSEDVYYAVNVLDASRVGHGISALNDKQVLDMLCKNNRILEICPTSNLFLKVVDKVSDLRLNFLSEHGVEYVLCTDNPARCSTSLSEEYFKASMAFGFSLDDVTMINRRALNNSFGSDSVKQYLGVRLEEHAQRSKA